MNLAPPAPKVESAVADAAAAVEAAAATRAPQSQEVRTSAAPTVEGAVEGAATVAVPDQTTPAHLSAQTLAKTALWSGRAAVIPGGAPKKDALKRWLPAVFDERDFVAFGEVEHFVVVAGASVFVFLRETDQRPLYALDLRECARYVREDPKRQHKQSVTISPLPKTNLPRPTLVTFLLWQNDQIYQITVDAEFDKLAGDDFERALQRGRKGKVQTAKAIAE